MTRVESEAAMTDDEIQVILQYVDGRIEALRRGVERAIREAVNGLAEGTNKALTTVSRSQPMTPGVMKRIHRDGNGLITFVEELTPTGPPEQIRRELESDRRKLAELRQQHEALTETLAP